MVLELALGGELFSVLANTEDGVIPEASCLFYAACVLSGLECMHSHNILYRDMKPENMMLDADGYIKVRQWGGVPNLRWVCPPLCVTSRR